MNYCPHCGDDVAPGVIARYCPVRGGNCEFVSRTPTAQPIAAPSSRSGKSSEDGGGTQFEILKPMNAKEYGDWFRGYDRWLRDLSKNFFRFPEGWVGEEGDPIHSKDVCAGHFACAGVSKIIMPHSLTQEEYEAWTGAWAIGPAQQLQLL